jgi:preprotein translocase subunit YajC
LHTANDSNARASVAFALPLALFFLFFFLFFFFLISRRKGRLRFS